MRTEIVTGSGRSYADVVAAWTVGAVMVVLATSLVGLFAAPVAVPLALYRAARPGTSWAVRVPLLLGASALTALAALWLLDGAGTGSTSEVGQDN